MCCACMWRGGTEEEGWQIFWDYNFGNLTGLRDCNRCLPSASFSMLKKQPGREAEASEARVEYHRRFSASRQAIAAATTPISAATHPGGSPRQAAAASEVLTFGRPAASGGSADRYGSSGGDDEDAEDDDPAPPVDGSLLLEESVSGSFGRKVGRNVDQPSQGVSKLIDHTLSIFHPFHRLGLQCLLLQPRPC